MNRLFINSKNRDNSLSVGPDNCIVYIRPFKINKLWKKMNLLYFKCPSNVYSQNLTTLHSIQLNISSIICQELHNNENFESQFIIPFSNNNLSYFANQHFCQSAIIKKFDATIIERLEIRLYRSDGHKEVLNDFNFEFLLEFTE